jgi:hypothetical protein
MRSFGPTAGSRHLCSPIGPEKGFVMMLNLGGARPIARVAIAILMSLALAFVIMATAETPASARRVRVPRSLPGNFVAPPDSPSEFTCYWVDQTAQYFCQAKRSDKKAQPPIGFALEAGEPGGVGLFADVDAQGRSTKDFVRPRRFSCSGSGTDPAAYSCTYRHEGKTSCFKLDKAMAITVEDDKTREIFIDTWFMPPYKKCN